MESPHVVFIVVDSLRKDYAKPLEIETKKLGFVPYENVIASASWTTPSHASMFTGLYPLLHGAHEMRTKKSLEVKLSSSKTLLTDVLKANYDYDTYLISANVFVSPYFGFKGFDNYFDVHPMRSSFLSLDEQLYIRKLRMEKSKIQTSLELIRNKKFTLLFRATLHYFQRRFRKVKQRLGIGDWPLDKGIKNAIKIVKAMKFDNPTFIFMNLMELHEPYSLKEPPTPKVIAENYKTNTLDSNVVKIWRENYPKKVAYVTRRILEMLKVLKNKGVFDKSLIIITSDHGQLLGEHNRIGHGTFLYDELTRVPLFIKYPKDQEIEHVVPHEVKHISLTKLKSYILGVISGKILSDEYLCDDVVFSESYGIPETSVINEISRSVLTEQEKKNIDHLEKYRVAIYYKNFRGVFNVVDWRFEEIISYDPKVEVTEDVVKRMKTEIVKFLRTATLIKTLKLES